MAKISVVIPLYNKAAYVSRAIDSVLAQTFDDFEIIVVNDASTDGGERVVGRYDDERIILYNRQVPSPGGHAARNFGINKAKTDFIAFLDADDEWTPIFLETVLMMRKEYPSAGAYTTGYEEKNSKRILRKPRFCMLHSNRVWSGIIPDFFYCSVHGNLPFCTISVAIPKNVFFDVGFFPDGVPRGGDHDMWVRIALKYDIAFNSCIGAVYYKDIPGSVVKINRVLEGYKAVETIESFLSANPNCTGSKLNNILQYADVKRLGSATHCIQAGEKALAKKHLKDCLTKRFLIRKYWLYLCAHMPGWMHPEKLV